MVEVKTERDFEEHYNEFSSRQVVGFLNDNNFDSAENIFDLLFRTTCQIVLTRDELESITRRGIEDGVMNAYKRALERITPDNNKLRVWYVGELVNYYTMQCDDFELNVFKAKMMNREPNDGIPKGIDGLFFSVGNDGIEYTISEVKFYKNDDNSIKRAIVELFKDLKKRLTIEQHLVFHNGLKPEGFPQDEFDELVDRDYGIPYDRRINIVLNLITGYDFEMNDEYYNDFTNNMDYLLFSENVSNKYESLVQGIFEETNYQNVTIDLVFTTIGRDIDQLKDELNAIFSQEDQNG